MKTEAERTIIVIDDVDPEANAMLQALYSRDPQSVTVHLERVRKIGSEKFMASYYVGYGHKSIGDCGTTTLYIEQVSILAAKAVQDWPLYNGQEASTRYLDMSGQAVLNPAGTAAGEEVQRISMELYESTLAALIPYLEERFPAPDGANVTHHLKSIKAKAFDIARGLLPAGVTTLLAWHTNLRQAHDHLKRLRHHPLPEIREIAAEITTSLRAKYPNSFSHKEYAAEEQYLSDLTPFAYSHAALPLDFDAKDYIRREALAPFETLLASRPAKSELPHEMRVAGDLEFRFLLDFGSFRDLQRHRSVSLPMPLLTTDYGFDAWYLDQLPASLVSKVQSTLTAQVARIEALGLSREMKQYYIPMGYRVACVMSASLPAALYLCELRSGQTVHPTLRKVSQAMGRYILERFPGCAMHCDFSDDAFSVKRGAQDIVKREAA